MSPPCSLRMQPQHRHIHDITERNKDMHHAQTTQKLACITFVTNAVFCAERCSSPQVQSLLASLLSHIHHMQASTRKHHTPGTRARPEHEPEAALKLAPVQLLQTSQITYSNSHLCETTQTPQTKIPIHSKARNTHVQPASFSA